MNKYFKATIYGGLTLYALHFPAEAQENKIKAILYDGVIVAGYADKGAYLNFAGPAIKFNPKPMIVLLGLLPSLKFKEDKIINTTTKNAFVTPTLGLGLTAAYRQLAFQVPCFYNSKTATQNGNWNVGFGIGYKL